MSRRSAFATGCRALAAVCAAAGLGLVFLGPGARPAMSIRYFTNQSNIMLLAFMLTALPPVRVRLYRTPERFDMVNSCATLYIAITGLVYALVLSGGFAGQGASSLLLHYASPTLAVLGFLAGDERMRLTWGRVLRALIYPVAYGTVILVNAYLGDGFVPYPFLDPAQGAGRLAAGLCMYLAGFAALYCALVLLHNAVSARRERRAGREA